MMCGVMTAADSDMQLPGTDIATATACQAAEVDYDGFRLTVAAGSYPCLPLAVGGAGRCFDEPDLLALYIYGRLLSFGFGALRAGEYACRIRAAIKANLHARVICIGLTSSGGKHVIVDTAAAEPERPPFPAKLEFDIPVIREFLKARIAASS
jgi:hypothetical protein